MEDRLDAKLQALKNVAKLYKGLVKKDYNYQYRLDAINEQLEILEELKNGGNDIIENWKVCFKEDSTEIAQN